MCWFVHPPSTRRWRPGQVLRVAEMLSAWRDLLLSLRRQAALEGAVATTADAGKLLVSDFSVRSLCSLCLCGGEEGVEKKHHRDTENTETAQRRTLMAAVYPGAVWRQGFKCIL